MGDLVAGGEDRLARPGNDSIVWPGTKNVAGQVAALEALEQARHADARAVLAALQHRRGHVLVAEPDRQRVEVERQADRGAAASALTVSASRGGWRLVGSVRTLDPERRSDAPWSSSATGSPRCSTTRVDAPAGARRIDLGGACVLPGFVDAHVHFPSWALGRRELRLFGCAVGRRGARRA